MPADNDPMITGQDRVTEQGLITRPFVMVSLATLVFFTYIGMLSPLLPLLIEKELGGNEFDIGLNIAAFAVAAIAARPALTRFAERYGLRAAMVGGTLLTGTATLLMSLVNSKWGLLPLRSVQGIGEACLFVGASTMISGFAPPHRRAEAASYFSAAVFGGIGIGPIISERVVADQYFHRGLLVAGCIAISASFVAMTLPRGTLERPPVGQRAGFHPAALKTGSVLALCIAGFTTFNAFIPDHARRIGLSGTQWIFVTYSIICLTIRIVGAKLPERMGLVRSVCLALSGVCAGLLVLAAFPTVTGAFAGTALIAFGMSFVFPALQAMSLNAVPDNERVRVISSFTMFFEVGSVTGGLLFGLVANVTSKRGGFVAGAISAAIGLWVLRTVVVPSLPQPPSSHDRPIENVVAETR